MRGTIVLLPFAYLFLLTKNPLWLQSSILTMSTLIIEEKLKFTVLGVLLHGLAIILGFYLLLLMEGYPVFFVFTCALFASSIIWITTKGDKLRSLASWCFIPALFLATEMRETANTATPSAFLFYLFSALLPTLGLAIIDQLKWVLKEGEKYYPLQLSVLNNFGERGSYLDSVMAMILAVGFSTFLVEFFQLGNPQWMIWGAASVVTGNILTTPTKFRQRLQGVLTGVPLGILLGQFIPNTPFDLTLITFFIFLTLIGFHRYVVAYFLRCTAVAIAAVVISNSTIIAFERITHVILGGLIGLAFVMICHVVVGRDD
ncbi:FUSC family protein [Legionella lansingensis]|uniref:Integral membrane bound transporter domain-containing protein n=2 Tax=Legionella lansingensis TaxID=45067 RepID=A0A0W0VZL3_9GAMM|nr:FUSC family protein [Legionella lansingensis]KTD25482.1 hypothetical protein Llan_0228 [Legionella lansingensis]